MRLNKKYTYSELKQLIQGLDLGLKSIKDWKNWVKSNRHIYPNIPIRPETSYVDEFEGYIVFLNLNKIKRTKYWSYDKCVSYLKKFKFSINEFRLHLRNNKEVLIPTRPEKVFKEFKSFSNFLGNGNDKTEYFSHDECIIFLRKFNIKTVRKFREFRFKNNWTFIPSNPEVYYKEFKTYNVFLSNNSLSSKTRTYLSYNESKDYISKFNFKFLDDYKNYVKNNKLNFLPLQPYTVYKHEFISVSDYLSNNSLSCSNLHKQYNINVVKDFIHKNNILCYTEYKEILSISNPLNLPKCPNTSLKGRGYNSVEDLFGISKKQSYGELMIEKQIKIIGIPYIKQHRFNDCKYKRVLPFDFYLPNYNLCIEYDGKQHHIPIKNWGGDKGLELRQLRDRIKTEYCESNNIKLIRINYDEDIIERMKYIFNNP